MLKGYINEFFETGCEGVMWYFFEDDKGWPDCIQELNNGDRLKVFGENGEILFDDIIEHDREAGWQPYFHVVRKYKKKKKSYPRDSAHGQPCALGYWIHWTQKGWEPDEWAKLFFHLYLKGSNNKPLRAELIKAKR